MDATGLTGFQLYVIIQNPALNKEIRKCADHEFNQRKFTAEQVREMSLKLQQQFPLSNDEPLKFQYRLLLVLFPFIVPIQSIIAGKYLARGQKRKWKNYWFYLSLGYLLWTVLTIVIARFFLDK